MSTLAEIEAAADSLPAAQKQELLFYVAARLRAEGGAPPPPRQFTKERMDGWVAEDEADMEKFRQGHEAVHRYERDDLCQRMGLRGFTSHLPGCRCE